MSIFADRIAKGLPITLFGDGSIRRDFTHVSDICRGLAATLFTPGIDGEAFNLGHDKPITMSELIRHLEAGLGRRAIIQKKPSRAEDMPLTHADLSKSRRLLGYAPTVSFDIGCAEYCDWYRGMHRESTYRAAA
jgi:UDP-glucuronate 4-epimerase